MYNIFYLNGAEQNVKSNDENIGIANESNENIGIPFE